MDSDRSAAGVTPRHIVVMGVAASGKSTVGRLLASSLGCPFVDGDDFHPPENIAKMAGGAPLDDSDRLLWLRSLRDLIREHDQRGESLVLACSALKERYRDILRAGSPHIVFIYLQGDRNLIHARMEARADHYMKSDLLESQFDALEPPAPDEALTVSINQSPDAMLRRILRELGES